MEILISVIVYIGFCALSVYVVNKWSDKALSFLDKLSLYQELDKEIEDIRKQKSVDYLSTLRRK